jgi:hypothetical protein
MATVATLYLAVGLALGCAWVATEMRLQPRRALAREFVSVSLAWPVIVATLIWPLVLALAVGLLFVKKSKKHDE